MGKREWLGAAIAAFGVGCSEEPAVDAKSGDIKDAKIEQAPKDVLARDEEDLELYVPVQPVVEKVESRKFQPKAGPPLAEKAGVEIEPQVFRNVLMEEADTNRPGKWMGDKYDDEVRRLKDKLPRDISKNKFNNSLEQLHRLFVPRGNDEKNGVIGLLVAVKEGKETRFFVNKEYRDKVKRFVEKYSAQYGVPVEIIYGVMAVENAGKHDPNKNKADGAYGIMQVKPDVVKEMARIYPDENWKDVSVSDLEGNIRTSVAYLEFLNKRYGGQWWASLMAYNAGHAGFERDFVASLEGSLEGRAKLRGEIRGIKKQIKALEEEEEIDEDAIHALKAKLQVKQEELSVQNEHLDQLRNNVARHDGWKDSVGKKNLRWAESKYGGGMYANSNARYSVEAEYLGKSMYQIMQSEGGEVKLTPLTDEMK